MKELNFYYGLRIRFSAAVRDHRFTLRCVPQDTACQKIRDLDVRIVPSRSLGESRDSFGNICIFGSCTDPHDLFSVEVKGVARTGLKAAEPAGEEHLYGRFRYQTNLTMPGEKISAFFREFSFPETFTGLDKAKLMMDALYRRFSYVSGVTNCSTGAEQAFSQGEGVCQDYAHILLSLCRLAGIPARYVVGMLLGEGASHAWVEVYDHLSWVPLDPTNPGAPPEDHIKISCGRDYSDCTINQGIMAGDARQSQQVEVCVWPVGEERQFSRLGSY